MIKNDFFTIYFVNENGLYKLDIYATNEQEAFAFIRTLDTQDLKEYQEYLNKCSSIILQEAKEKENAVHSFEKLVEVGTKGFMAGWKNFLIRERINEIDDNFRQYVTWWIRSFINDYIQNPPQK